MSDASSARVAELEDRISAAEATLHTLIAVLESRVEPLEKIAARAATECRQTLELLKGVAGDER